jgi:hypothetical protein
MTVGDVLDDLKRALRDADYVEDGERGGYEHAKAETALAALLASKSPDDLAKLFSASLDAPPIEEDFTDEDDFDEAQREWEQAESCQAWFLFHWDVAEEDDESE